MSSSFCRFVSVLSILTLSVASQSPYQAEFEEIAAGSKLTLNLHESESFVFVSCLGAGQAKVVADAMEKGLSEFRRLGQIAGREELFGKEKVLVVITRNSLDHKAFAKWYGAKYKPYDGFVDTASRTSYFPQPYPRVCVMAHLKPATAESIKHYAVHILGHLCVMRYAYHHNFIPPWLEEGFGCWLESKVLGKSTCYCFQGVSGDSAKQETDFTMIDWTKWKTIVKGDAVKKIDRPMRSLVPIAMHDFSFSDIGKVWSVIDFLLAEDPAKFFAFLRSMKSHWPKTYEFQHTPEKMAAQDKAMQEAFGFTFDELDAKWRQHVRAKYR